MKVFSSGASYSIGIIPEQLCNCWEREDLSWAAFIKAENSIKVTAYILLEYELIRVNFIVGYVEIVNIKKMPRLENHCAISMT